LLDQVREQIRYLHYSIRTEEAYVHWVRAFVRFHGLRHPRQMGEVEVRAFLGWLTVERHVSVSTHRQALAALLFLYQRVFGQSLPWMAELERPQRKARLPVVLTVDEVRRVLGLLDGTHAVLARLLDGTGLRITEALQLRVKDVEFDRQAIIVRAGKLGLSCLPIARAPGVGGDGTDADNALVHAVEDGVRISPDGQQAPAVGRWCAERRKLGEQFSLLLDLQQKVARHLGADVGGVEAHGFRQFGLGLRRELPVHARSARRRSTACWPDTQDDSPRAMRASRSSASADHAAAHSGSVSRLAIRRSISRERSAWGRLSASASRTSMGMGMCHLVSGDQHATGQL